MTADVLAVAVIADALDATDEWLIDPEQVGVSLTAIGRIAVAALKAHPSALAALLVPAHPDAFPDSPLYRLSDPS